jgi:hypothetical protein
MSAMGACEPIALILPGKPAAANAAAEALMNALRSTAVAGQAKGILQKNFEITTGEL